MTKCRPPRATMACRPANAASARNWRPNRSRKSARDVLLDEAARIMGDVVDMLSPATGLASRPTADGGATAKP
jgi:hypothetical protein